MQKLLLFFSVILLLNSVSTFAAEDATAKAVPPSQIYKTASISLSSNNFVPLTPALLASSETLNRIKQRGSINLAAYAGSIPFNFVSDKSEQVGYAWEISLRVADRIKRELALPNITVNKVEVNFKTRFAAVNDKLVDLECASTSNTVDRQRTVTFSLSNFVVGARLLVRSDAKISDWPDLANKTIAVAGGTSNEKMINELSQVNGWNVKVLPVKDNSEAFGLVEEGKAQAVLGHEIGLYTLKNKSRSLVNWSVVAPPRALEAHGCVMAKGDRIFKLIVDDEITRMMKSGDMDKLYMKYFLQKLPLSNSYSLGIAPSQEIYNLYKRPNDLAQ